MLKRIYKTLLSLLIYFVPVYLVLIALLYFGQREMLYYPFGQAQPPQDVEVVKAVDTTNRGYVPTGWFIPPKDGKPIIVHYHGNASRIDNPYHYLRPFVSEGYGVLLAEYSGYNGNAGSPSKESLYADAEGYHALLIDMGYQTTDIVMYGESLGSGPATYIAGKYQTRGLILHVPFDSLYNVAKSRYWFVLGLKYLMKDQYDNLENLQGYKGASLVLLAENDRIIPVSHGRNLYNALSDKKTLKVYQGLGHNDAYNQTTIKDKLDFLNTL